MDQVSPTTTMQYYFPINVYYFMIFLNALKGCPYCIGDEQCGYRISEESLNQGVAGLRELRRKKIIDVNHIVTVARWFLCERHEAKADELAHVWSRELAQGFGLDVPGPHGQNDEAPNAAHLNHEDLGGSVSEHGPTSSNSTSFVAQSSRQDVETSQRTTSDSPPSRSVSPSASTTGDSGIFTPASSINTMPTSTLSDQSAERNPSPVLFPSNNDINIHVFLHLPTWSFRPFTRTHFLVPFLMTASTLGLFAMCYYRNA